MIVLAFCISSVTGAFHWYVDFMDDEDEIIYTKRLQLKGQKKKLRSLLRTTISPIRKTCTKSSSMHSNIRYIILGWRLRLFQIKSNMTQRMKKCPNIIAILDLVAFYLIYLVCTGFIYTNIIKPMTEIPKIDLLNQLPSNRFNITQGYHPSVVNRYLNEGIKLDYSVRKNNNSTDTGTIQNMVHQDLIRLLQKTMDDTDQTFEEKNGTIYVNKSKSYNGSSSSCTIHDIDNPTEDPNQCKASNDDVIRNITVPFRKKWYRNDRSMDTENYDELWTHYQMDISSHFLAFQELETKWTEEDYIYMENMVSPFSNTELFGKYDACLMRCFEYFFAYVFVLIGTLVLLSLMGVSAVNIW